MYRLAGTPACRAVVTAAENPARLRSQATVAALCGASPIRASSGKTNRYRLNWGGGPAGNRALHMIAVVRMRSCSATRGCVQRPTTEGMSTGDHALLQALHRPHGLPRHPRRPRRTDQARPETA